MDTVNNNISDYTETDHFAHIPVFFVTTRKFKEGKFLNARDDKRLHCGQYMGSVNKKASTWQWKMILTEDLGFFFNVTGLWKVLRKYSPVKLGPRLVYAGSEEQDIAELLDRMDALLKKLGWSKIFLFDHGMEQTMEAAAMRTVIQGYNLRQTAEYPELGCLGLAICWPADRNGYGGAGGEAMSSVSFIEEKLIPALIERFGADNIIDLSHSMGGRIAAETSRSHKAEKESDRYFLRCLVASDVDADTVDSRYRESLVNSTQADSLFIFDSRKDKLMLISQTVAHQTLTQDWGQFVRWAKQVELPYDQLRLVEHLRLGQFRKLPRWPGFVGVDYTLADGLAELTIFGIYLGIGHSFPYPWIKKLVVRKLRDGKAKVFENLEHTRVVDKPNRMLYIEAEPRKFRSFIEMFDE